MKVERGRGVIQGKLEGLVRIPEESIVITPKMAAC